MTSINHELAELFEEIADLLAISGGGFFQVRAYREAARVMREESEPIEKEKATLEAFQELPGIGEALAAKMMHYIQTGKIDYLEELRAQVPSSVRDLLSIPGLGPKSVGKLFVQLGIRSKEDLLEKAKQGELEKLEGFGPKSVEKILASIASHQEKKKRHERAEAQEAIEKILPKLRSLKGVKRAEAAGSYRRQAPTVGDVDILVGGSASAKQIEAALRELFPQMKLLGSGETKISFVLLPQDLQVDVRAVPLESYGAALLYFTGSKDFNVSMRRKAIEQGCLLNEYSLSRQGEVLASRTEEEIFEALGMRFVEPEKRK